VKVIALLLLLCTTALAQETGTAPPSLYKVEIDNAWVRVSRLTLGPRQKAPPRRHMPEVIVFVTQEPGRTSFRPAGTDSDENRTDAPLEQAVIELKQNPPTSMRVGLDPVVIDPQYHKVLLDNQYVRAIRTVLEPGVKSPLHEHPHYVVVYITELHTTMKLGDGREVDNPRRAGEIGWRDYMKHETLNIGKQTAAEIQVELK
jgi:predicted metal-dependent enzyme (double-stranded beta helix superfamily)